MYYYFACDVAYFRLTLSYKANMFNSIKLLYRIFWTQGMISPSLNTPYDIPSLELARSEYWDRDFC